MSNGNPSDPNSLHYWDPQRNQYVNCMRAVGSILQSYDTDQKFPLLGFGGKYNKDALGQYVSHCFALNGDIYNPEVVGVEGCVQVYRKALPRCYLYGPSQFRELLPFVMGFCSGNAEASSQLH